MKIRWRQHEIIFATGVAVIAFAAYLWHTLSLSAQQINEGIAAPFINNHVTFNVYRNYLLPQIAKGLLIYFAYLFVNLFTIPRLLYPKKFEAGTSKISISFKKISLHGMAGKLIKEFLWLVIQILLIIFFLGAGFNIAEYFINECYFSYAGFTFFPANGFHPKPTMDLRNGFQLAFAMIGLYALYVCMRELVINLIEKPGNKKDYRILIWNQVTLVLIEYLLVPFFLLSFKFISGYIFFVAYFALVPPLYILYMSNIYWLFPWKGDRKFLSQPVILRLLISTFLFTFPFVFFIAHGSISFVTALIIFWFVQQFGITPISWQVYKHNKDKILQLKGVQKELVKSKTDLQFLRSQINPHFLFNVLNTLYGTALQENAERTASSIQKLGDMMRFMLHENNQDFIEMKKEVEYLKNYIALQKLRTQSSPEIIIEDNIADQNCDYKIAPMLLIPFVENAFKHGISLQEKSWIKINLSCDDKNIFFEVRNSMHAKQNNDPEINRSGIGFNNVMERLKLMYGGRFQISVNGDGKEFFVKLSLRP